MVDVDCKMCVQIDRSARRRDKRSRVRVRESSSNSERGEIWGLNRRKAMVRCRYLAVI